MTSHPGRLLRNSKWRASSVMASADRSHWCGIGQGEPGGDGVPYERDGVGHYRSMRLQDRAHVSLNASSQTRQYANWVSFGRWRIPMAKFMARFTLKVRFWHRIRLRVVFGVYRLVYYYCYKLRLWLLYKCLICPISRDPIGIYQNHP